MHIRAVAAARRRPSRRGRAARRSVRRGACRRRRAARATPARGRRGSATPTSRRTATAGTTSQHYDVHDTYTGAHGRCSAVRPYVTAHGHRRTCRRSTSTWCSTPDAVSVDGHAGRASPRRGGTSWSSRLPRRSRHGRAVRGHGRLPRHVPAPGTAWGGERPGLRASPTRRWPPTSRRSRRGGSRPTTTRATRRPSTSRVTVPARPAGGQQRQPRVDDRDARRWTTWHWRIDRADGDLPRVLRRRPVSSRDGVSHGLPYVTRSPAGFDPTDQDSRCGCCDARRGSCAGSRRSSAPTRSRRRAGVTTSLSARASPWRTRRVRRTPSSAAAATARARRRARAGPPVVRRPRRRSTAGATSGSTRASRRGPSGGTTRPTAARSASARLRRAYAAYPAGRRRSGGCAIGDPGRPRPVRPAVYDRGAMTLQALRAPDRQRRLPARCCAPGSPSTAAAPARSVSSRRSPSRSAGEDLDGFFERWLSGAAASRRRDARPTACAEQDERMADYRSEHARSIEDPEGFWGEQAGLVDWIKQAQRVLDDEPAAVLPLVPRRDAQHLLQRARPARRRAATATAPR